MSTTMKEVLGAKGSKVYSVDATSSMKVALHELDAHEIGALLVYDGHNNVDGIITERDIMRALVHTTEDIRFHSVQHHMTHREKLIIATPEDTLEYAMSVMTNNHIRQIGRASCRERV